jgi:hypothetical protein
MDRTIAAPARPRAAVAVALALTLVAALLALGVALAAPAHSGQKPEVRPEWGKTTAKNGVLRKRCRNYTYSYAITPPEGLWGLETFLVGPRGKPLASGAMVIGQDEPVGKDKFRICRPTTRAGVFKIKAKLSVQNENGGDYQEGWLPVTKFRLRNPR